MFENAAEKLSKVIKVVTVLEMIACIILGIIFATAEGSFLVFVIVSVLGTVFIWVGSLFTIGLLDMMSDVNQIRNSVYIAENRQLMANNSNMANAQTVSGNYWTCDKCNAENTKDAAYCENCGAKKNVW